MRFIFLLALILLGVSSPYAASQAAGGANWICASTPPASPIGTTIGPAISITDYNGVVWTVQGGAVYADGLPACTSSKTALLLYYYGKIYKQNDAKAWAVWDGTCWKYVPSDPRIIGVIVVPPPNPPPTSSLVVNVRSTGAVCDGITDDTAAIQAAINLVGGTGGNVLVPAGTCVINPDIGLRMKTGMTFNMATGAVLQARASSRQFYSMILLQNVSNVTLVGGTLIGERAIHTGVGGEWGMGVNIISSSNIYVGGMTVKDAWGDGFYVGGDPVSSQGITLDGVIADHARRQGVSITNANGVLIKNSAFINTNGTAPSSGIDLEPNNTAQSVVNVQILSSQFLNNAGTGITATGWFNHFVGGANILIDGNTIRGNGYSADGSLIYDSGVFAIYTQNVTISNNNIFSPKRGVNVEFTTETVITNNTICSPTPLTFSKNAPIPEVARGNTTSTEGCP
jgi:hypothetical protein